MMNLALIFFHCIVSFSGLYYSSAADTLTPTQSIRNGSTLVSSGQSFELGFFSPGNSKNRYFGIWYKQNPETVTRVANRNNPITGSNGFSYYKKMD